MGQGKNLFLGAFVTQPGICRSSQGWRTRDIHRTLSEKDLGAQRIQERAQEPQAKGGMLPPPSGS